MAVHHSQQPNAPQCTAFTSPACTHAKRRSSHFGQAVTPLNSHRFHPAFPLHFTLPQNNQTHTTLPSIYAIQTDSHPHVEQKSKDYAPLDIYFATCARGLGEYLSAELTSPPINAEVLSVASSGVRFRATDHGHDTGYRACLWLRTAMRVLLEVDRGEIKGLGVGSDADEVSLGIYDFVRECADWGDMLDGGRLSFNVQVRVNEGARNKERRMGGRRGWEERRGRNGGGEGYYPREQSVQTIVKDAVCDAVRDGGNEKPNKPGSHAEADIPLFVTLHGGEICVYLDMAGRSLHKRGYREDTVVHKSALNEAVAAGMLYVAGFRPDGSYCREGGGKGRDAGRLVVVDPMCGSGTLLIEAALLRLRVAVGLYRREFAFENWLDFNREVYSEIVEEAVGMQRADEEMGATFIGNDVNGRALGLARRNLEQTRLTGLVSLCEGDVRELVMPREASLVISNPPWGLRLEGEGEAWEGLGKFLREYGGGGLAVLLSGEEGLSRGLRMRTRKKVPVRIGNVDTRVLVYDVLPKRQDGEKGSREEGMGREGDGMRERNGKREGGLRVSKVVIESNKPVL